MYTHYVYDTLPYDGEYLCNYEPFTQEYNWSFYQDIILCIDTQILRDLPFVVCDEMLFGRCVPWKEYRIMESSGYHKRKPSMARLKRHIEKLLLPEDTSAYQNGESHLNNRKVVSDCITYNYYRGYLGYINTHEVLFQEIPYAYISGILIHTSTAKKYERSFPGKNSIDYIRSILPPSLQTIPIRVYSNTEHYKDILKPIATTHPTITPPIV